MKGDANEKRSTNVHGNRQPISCLHEKLNFEKKIQFDNPHLKLLLSLPTSDVSLPTTSSPEAFVRASTNCRSQFFLIF